MANKDTKIRTLIFFGVIIFFLSIYYFGFLSKNNHSIVSNIDFIKVDKSERKLYVYSDKKLIKTYDIALGKNPVGAKQYQGDTKTPEGVYYINGKNSKSIAYKNLGISYPNKHDIKVAQALGKSTGGDIKIHGIMNGWGAIGKFHRCLDWTNGCLALTNGEIDELSKCVKIGTKIEIVP